MADQDSTLTQEYLQSIFKYRDGELYWKIKKAKSIKVGDRAGFQHYSGYRYVSVNRRTYAIHRLIFMMHHGYLPKIIDHKDNNLFNNKIENLREATNKENSWNSKRYSHNTSGYKNVSFDKQSKKWRVRILIDGVSMSFGLYFDKEVAKFIAETMRYKYHKEFANNG